MFSGWIDITYDKRGGEICLKNGSVHTMRLILGRGAEWLLPRWNYFFVSPPQLFGYTFGAIYQKTSMNREDELDYMECIDHLANSSPDFEIKLERAASILEKNKIGQARFLRNWQRLISGNEKMERKMVTRGGVLLHL